MSLVSEALRKIRAQQLERAVQSGQLPPAVAPAPKAGTTRSLSSLLLASLLSGALGAALAVFLTTRQGLAPPIETSSTATRATPVPAPVTPPARAPQTIPQRETVSSPAPPVPVGTPTVVPEPTAASGGVGPTPAIPPPSTPRQPEEFVLEAHVAGGHLRLEYLVYGAGRGFARINGQEVTTGSTVEGFSVDAILVDRVILRKGGEVIVLRLR